MNATWGCRACYDRSGPPRRLTPAGKVEPRPDLGFFERRAFSKLRRPSVADLAETEIFISLFQENSDDVPNSGRFGSSDLGPVCYRRASDIVTTPQTDNVRVVRRDTTLKSCNGGYVGKTKV